MQILPLYLIQTFKNLFEMYRYGILVHVPAYIVGLYIRTPQICDKNPDSYKYYTI